VFDANDMQPETEKAKQAYKMLLEGDTIDEA